MDETETNDNKSRDDTPLDNDDLDLVDAALEDEGKSDADLWKEFDQEESGATNDDAPDDDAGAIAAAAADEPELEPEPDDALAADDTASDEPGDDTPGAADAAGEDDPWATATPEQKAAFDAAQAQIEKLTSDEASHKGRLRNVQRELNDLRSRVDAATPASDAGDDAGDGSGAGEDVFTSDNWKSFEGEYPEVSGPIKTLVSDLLSRVTNQQKQLDAIGNDRLEEAIDEQTALLEEDHPDWQDVTDDEGFEDWLAGEPRHVQQAAVRNADKIVDAAEAADVVGRFKAFRSEGAGDAPNDDTPETTVTTEGKGGTKTRLSGKRKRQLESASSTRKGGAGAAHGIPEDGSEEEIWKAFDKMEEREAQRA